MKQCTHYKNALMAAALVLCKKNSVNAMTILLRILAKTVDQANRSKALSEMKIAVIWEDLKI